ncbi:MAG TPA: hypothetical protein VKB49_11885 [Candidatus Sulfotelmatobacter sp.]|nr:hypothetical protein [Candidatus Sulfotelmatobacter sp.]
MPRISSTAEGFRTAFRRPSFALAEIIWRWVVGVTATLLLLFGFFEYLDTLPVNYGETLFLKSGQPFLISQAIAHVLRGSVVRAVLSLMVAALLLVLLWIIAASLGRATILRAILDSVGDQLAAKAAAMGVAVKNEPRSLTGTSWESVATLARLNFLRVSLALATIIALLGASILAGFASSETHPRPGVVFFLFVPLAVLVGLAWFGLNWLLSLAAVFAVKDGEGAVGAISAAVCLCRERPGAIAAVSTWTGLAHLVAFVAATTAVSLPMGFAGLLPWRLVVLAILAVTVAYFAVADWIYTARLAGYVAIIEMPEDLWKPAMPPTPATPATPVPSSIDRDELILSDLPGLIPET